MLILILLAIPLFSAGLLLCVEQHQTKTRINILASFLTCCVSIMLAVQITQEGNALILGKWLYVDHLSMLLIIVTSLIGLTTAIFGGKYLMNEQLCSNISLKKLRFYCSLYQFFFFVAFLILVSNNLGIVWVGLECATLGTVLLVSLYRSPQSLEAAWKYLILCGLGLAQALLGTILLYFAAEKILSPEDALLWSELHGISHQLSTPMVTLAFVFIFIGYGAKAGFVPLHNWLPDVYGESLAPVLSLLSGVLLNLALYAIIRFKMIMDGALGHDFTTPFFLGFGLLNITIAGFFLLRQREVKRLFAYSSIEHIGIICFALGVGTPLALFAALLHMVSHALAKTAAFFSVGNATQLRGELLMNNIRGLMKDHPSTAWILLLSSIALLGLPPFSLFMTEFLIIFETVKHHVVWAAPLIIALMIAFAAVLYHVQQMVFSPNDRTILPKTLDVSVYPAYLHLILLLGLGILVPVAMMQWLSPIIHLMGQVL